jgi:Uma2 family endonuclease
MAEQTAWTTETGEQRITMSAAGEQRITMSYEEFLEQVDESTHAEWVDGEAIIFMPPTILHQRITMFLSWLLFSYINIFKLGELLSAPVEMRIHPDGNAREPDLIFVAREHLDRLTDKRLTGPADLAIELVSNESIHRDRTEKFYEYQAGGVREYWLIDPRPGQQRVDCYWLAQESKYLPIAPDEQARYHSHVLPGFWFREAWLWQEPLPDPLMTLAEIRGLSPEETQTLRMLLER